MAAEAQVGVGPERADLVARSVVQRQALTIGIQQDAAPPAAVVQVDIAVAAVAAEGQVGVVAEARDLVAARVADAQQLVVGVEFDARCAIRVGQHHVTVRAVAAEAQVGVVTEPADLLVVRVADAQQMALCIQMQPRHAGSVFQVQIAIEPRSAAEGQAAVGAEFDDEPAIGSAQPQRMRRRDQLDARLPVAALQLEVAAAVVAAERQVGIRAEQADFLCCGVAQPQ